jgi:hypothetical protein
VRADPSTRVTTAIDGLTVGLVAVVVCTLHGFDGPLGRDLGVFTYGGEQVASGVPPYAGVFNSVGPLSDALPGLAIWVGRHLGADPVTAERHLYVLLAAGCCVLLAVLARDVLGSRAAGFVAPALLLTFQDFLGLASDGPREKTAMVLLLLAALVLLGRRRWVGAGVCTALATLTWQPALVVAVVAAAVLVLGMRTGRVRAAVAFVAAGAATTAVFAAWFAATGDLRLAVQGFVVVNAEYTRQPSLLADPGSVGAILWRGYHGSLLLAPAGLLALFVLAARAVPGAVRGEARELRLAAVGAAALAGTAWTAAVINGAPDLFELLPFAALGLAGAAVRLAAALRPTAARAVVAAVTLVAVTAAGAEAVATRSDVLERERADVAAVVAAAPPGATVLSINTPEVLALAGRANPSRYQVFDRAMDGYLQHTWPGGLAGYARWVARTRPTLIACTHGQQSWPDRVLRRDYWYAGRGPAWDWYVSRSAGRATRSAVHAAIRDARRSTG